MESIAIKREDLLQTVAVRTGCGQLMTLVFEATRTIAGELLIESALRVIPEIWVESLKPNGSDDFSDTVPAIGAGPLEPFQIIDTGGETSHLARYEEANVHLDNGQRIHFFCLSRINVSFLALRVLNKANCVILSGETSTSVQRSFFDHLQAWAQKHRLEPDVRHPVVKFRW